MDGIAAAVESFFKKADQYGKTSLELLKLRTIGKSADAASSLISRLVVAAFIALSFAVLNIGASLWIGEMAGKSYHGFFIVAAFDVMVAAVLNVFRHSWIKTPVYNSIVKRALKQ